MNELFDGTGWADVLRAAYGFAVQRTATGVPYVVLDDLAGRRVTALPFVDYLPVGDPDLAARTLAELREKYPDHTLTLKTILAEQDAPAGPEIARRAVYHRYFGGKESSEFRRATRKAERGELTVRRSTEAAASERFQEMYHWQRLRKFGGIPQPPSFFRAVHEAFVARGEGFYLEAVLADGTVAASLVILREGEGWFYKFGTSDPAYLSLRPNNLLFRHLTTAVRDGEAAFLDLGLSGASDAYAGLRRFKSGTGAEEFPVTYLRVPGAPDPGAAQFLDFVRTFSKDTVAADRDRLAVAPISEQLYRFFA